MTHWLIQDFVIVFVYGLQHSLLTTKPAVALYSRIFPSYTWNISYSVLSVITLVVGFQLWETSGVVLYHLIPGSVAYHVSTIILALSLFSFFYFFKFTTSFWQWLGVKQVILKIQGKKLPEYYRVRKQGVKRYIRFPHHTALIVLFWAHPVMMLDTLFLAITATIYLYLGTYHQDLRGLSAIGKEWEEYRKDTALLIPGPKVLRRIFRDLASSEPIAEGSSDATKDAGSTTIVRTNAR